MDLHLDSGAIYEYNAFLACSNEPSTVSVNWNTHSTPIDVNQVKYEALTSSTTRSVASCLDVSPFTFDTGATCHISPEQSDFRSLKLILPHPVKGLGGACVYTIGIGSINLSIA